MTNTSSLPGKLIVIEGIDGSGKSSTARELTHQIRTKTERQVLLTREPGATPFGKNLRGVLGAHLDIDPIAQFLTFAADRAEHIAKYVLPTLQSGNFVVSDRMADSSVVYQSMVHGIDRNMVDMVKAWAMRGIQPDLTVFVDTDATIAAQRLAAGASDLNIFEKEAMLARAREAFIALYKDRKDVIIIDGTAPIFENVQKIISYCQNNGLL